MSDLISRQAAIDALDKRFDSIPMEQATEICRHEDPESKQTSKDGRQERGVSRWKSYKV